MPGTENFMCGNVRKRSNYWQKIENKVNDVVFSGVILQLEAFQKELVITKFLLASSLEILGICRALSDIWIN